MVLDPIDEVLKLLVSHDLSTPAGELGDNTAHLMDQIGVLEVEHANERLEDVLLVLFGVNVEDVHSVLVLN